MPLINCKVELSLTWNENCVLAATSNANNATFNKIDTKLYVPVVTLSTEDRAKLSNQLSKGFKRPVYWNKYKMIDNKLVEITDADGEKYISKMLDSSYQGVKELFVLAYDNQVIKFLLILPKYIFFSRVPIRNYNNEIVGRSIYDQPINDSFKQYDEVRKVSTGQVDDYTTGSLLDYKYLKDNYT